MFGGQLDLDYQLWDHGCEYSAYVALFEVMHVDMYSTTDLTGSLVDNPACSPTARPGYRSAKSTELHLQSYQKLPVLYLLPTVSKVNIGFSTFSCFLASGAAAAAGVWSTASVSILVSSSVT